MLEPNLTADSIVIAGADGRIRWCNKRASKLFGFAQDRHLAVSRETLTPCFEDCVLRRVLNGERVAGVEMRLRGESTRNETRWLTVTADPVFAAEKVDSVIAVFHDITERRRTEQRFRRLLDSNIVGIALWDKDHVISEANEAFLGILGRSPGELASLRLEDLPAPAFVKAAEKAFAEIREHGVCEPFPCEYLATGGARIPVLLGGASLEEGSGLVFALDISERNRLEEKLRQTAKLESLGILAGGIAHDFNNLLTGILGNTTLALDEAPPGSHIAELLQAVTQACEGAAGLVNQILAYSGRGRFRLEHVDLSALLAETLSLIETAMGRAVRLHIEIAPDLPFVEADPSQLQQIVMNLAINAAEAVDNKGEVWVRTGTEKLDGTSHPNDILAGGPAPGNYVFLEVRDSGPGMDQKTLKRIFDPFFSTKSAGRGLGLAAVLGIVRSHAGAIRVASAAGGGTTFCVYLPASQSRPAAARQDGPHEHCRTGMIMVVDDESYVRQIVRRTLEAAGYTVICAANSAEALQLFHSLASQIELAIVDMTMPGEEGHEVVRRLRHYDPGLKVVATSGYAEAEVRAKFGDLMDAFLPKPYRSDHLCRVVASTLAGSAV